MERAIRFQRTIERMFCGLGARGDGRDGNLEIAKQMRMLAGQTASELDDDISAAGVRKQSHDGSMVTTDSTARRRPRPHPSRT
jgi:hypothetical protein